MLKNALAVVAGYVAMAVSIMAVVYGLFLAIGADGAFQPGTYEVSLLWLVVSLVASLFAAILGGLICAWVAGNSRAPRSLAILVVSLGLIMAWPALNQDKDPRPTIRTADVGYLAAMSNTRQPFWVALSLPFLGAVGILIGAARVRRVP